MDSRTAIIATLVAVFITFVVIVGALFLSFRARKTLHRITVFFVACTIVVIVWGWKYYASNALPYLRNDDTISGQ